MEIVPPKAQVRVADWVSAGLPPIMTAPAGFHGPTGVGVQGWGVRTPIAAAVADATAGFAIEVQLPQGPTLDIGAISIMVAKGFPPVVTVCWDDTFNTPAPRPIGHIMDAPITTATLIKLHLVPIRFSPGNGNPPFDNKGFRPPRSGADNGDWSCHPTRGKDNGRRDR